MSPSNISKQLGVERSEDFVSYYANNTTVESSVWDLRILFGQIDQAAGKAIQSMSVTMPWNLAKLLVFHLQVQIAAYEIQHGKVSIADDIMPPPFPVPPDELKNNPAFEKVFEAINKIQADFAANNKS
jgi:hypothetical protein